MDIPISTMNRTVDVVDSNARPDPKYSHFSPLAYQESQVLPLRKCQWSWIISFEINPANMMELARLSDKYIIDSLLKDIKVCP